MVYKTILLILFSVVCNAQVMLNPDRANTITPPSGGGADTVLVASAGNPGGSANASWLGADSWSYLGNDINPDTVIYFDIIEFYCIDFSGGASELDSNTVAVVYTLSGADFDVLQYTSEVRTDAIQDSVWTPYYFATQCTLSVSTDYGLAFRKEPIGTSLHSPHMTYASANWQPINDDASARSWDETGTSTNDFGANSWSIRFKVIE